MSRHKRGKIVYSASSKTKLEAVATVAATLLLAAAPPVALAVVQRHLALPPRQSRRAAQAALRSRSATRTTTPEAGTAEAVPA